MAEDFGGSLGIRATIDATEVQKGAAEFISAIEKMQKAASSASDAMSDGFTAVRSQIDTLTAAIDAIRDKLTSISSAMGKVQPVDSSAAQSYEEIKEQVESLTRANEDLQTKLTAASASLAEQAKSAGSAKDSIDTLNTSAQTLSQGAVATVGASAKSQMKELGETIAFDTEQVKLMEQEYANLETKLASLQVKKQTASATPVQSDPLAQGAHDAQMTGLTTQIEQTQAKMTSLKGLTAEYKGEIAQCTQQMAQLGSQTTGQTTKSVTLRTELRNARQAVAEMIINGQTGNAEFGKAVNNANKLQAAFNKASAAISGKGLGYNALNMLSTAIGGVTGAMSTYMGVAGLFTDNQEELVKIQTDLQAVMSVSMGVQQLMSAATQIGVKWDTLKASALAAVAAESSVTAGAETTRAASEVATTAATGAGTVANWSLVASLKAVSLAIKSIPVIGWIIAAVTALAAAAAALYKWFTRLTPEEERAKAVNDAYAEGLQKLRETMAGASKSIGESVSKYKSLQQEYNAVKGDSAKLNSFIEANKDNFDELGLSIDNASDAEKWFVQQTNRVIEGFQLRAKAAAAAQAASQAYTYAFRYQMDAEGWGRSKREGADEYQKRSQVLSKRFMGIGDSYVKMQVGYQSQYNAMGFGGSRQGSKKADKAETGKTGKSSRTNSGGTGGKSAAERTFENQQKWDELAGNVADSVTEKYEELSDILGENKSDSASKTMTEALRTYNKRKRELIDWITELGKQRKQTAKDTWVNAKDGRTEYQWSKTPDGQKTDAEWAKEVEDNNEQVRALVKDFEAAILVAYENQRQKAVDDIISAYSQSLSAKKEQLAKLQGDIAGLEKLIASTDDEVTKNTARMALARTKSELEWVQQSKQAWNDYIKKYGDFAAKAKVMKDEYERDIITMPQGTAERASRDAQFNNDVSSLAKEEGLSKIDWVKSFGSYAQLSVESLQKVKQQLIDIIDLDERLSEADKSSFREQIKQINAQLASNKKAYLGGNNWLSSFVDIGAKRDENQLILAEYQRKFDEAQQKVEEAEQRVEEANLKAIDAEGKLAEFLSRDNVNLKSYQLKGISESEALQAYTDAGGTNPQEFQSLHRNVATTAGNAASAQQASLTATQQASNAGDALGNVMEMIGSGGEGGFGQGVKWAETIIKGVNQNIQSLRDLVNKFGDEDSDFSKGMNDFADSSSEAVAAFDSWKNGDAFGVVLHLSNAFEKLGSSVAHFFGYDGGERDYKHAVERYEKLSGIWDDLIDKKKEYIELEYGDDASEEIKNVQALYKAEESAIKKVMQTWLSKRSWNAHSQAYRNTQEVNALGGFAKWSALAGVDISSIEDLYNKDYSYDELVALKSADNGEFWASLQDEMRDYLGKLIDCKESTEDFAETAKEKLTGIKFDDLASNFMDTLEDMNASVNDFVSDFTDSMRKALIDNSLGTEAKAWLEDFTERYQQAVTDDGGTISQEHAQAFREELTEYAKQYKQAAQSIAEASGLGAGTTSDASTKGYATASEDSIAELSGRALAANEALWQIRDIQLSQNSTFEAINDAVARISESNSAQQSFYDESIDIQRNSVTYLANIAKNTNELYNINESLSKIEKHTRNL
jgi:hypothetical protein